MKTILYFRVILFVLFILWLPTGAKGQTTLPDISTVAMDMELPPIHTGVAAAGLRTRVYLSDKQDKTLSYLLYLPTDWKPGKLYPVLVEYPGNGPYLNKYGDTSSGEMEECCMAYGLSGGKGYITVSLPFVSADRKQQLQWWGDIEATKQYCRDVIDEVCARYGGDSRRVVLMGFSRGAIACNYIGLHDDNIASLWCGMLTYSHYDGALTHWTYPEADTESAKRRLRRLNGRPQLISQEGSTRGIQTYLNETGIAGNFSFLTIPFRNHNSTWLMRPTNEREIARQWLTELTEPEVQRFVPVADGYVRQQQGDFVSILTYGEVKKASKFAREIYLDFDLSALTIDANSAKLRVHCQSFDKYGELILSAYGMEGNLCAGLTWDNRPEWKSEIAQISVNQLEDTGIWLEWDVSGFISTIAQSESQKATIALIVTSGNDAMIKLSLSESGTTCPQLVISDQTTGGETEPQGKIKMPTLFSDNMVLQRDKPIAVWGETEPTVGVKLEFAGQEYETTSNESGAFRFLLPLRSASSESYTMTISACGESVTYGNIVMGDVWITSGQSNMALKLASVLPEQLSGALADARYPQIRYFDVAKIVNGGVLINEKDKPWREAIPERVTDWSAIAFFFGRDLYKQTSVPVGIINCSHGGATADAFISPQAYREDSRLNAAKCPDGTGIYVHYTTPSSLYEQMVKKLVGYNLKGVLWYQGESNAKYADNYETVFKGLIADWRKQWNEPELPFLFVQLPAYERPDDIGGFSWAEMREAQLKTWQDIAHTGMAVTVDVGEYNNIHPQDKYTVARRLLAIAKGQVYGQPIAYKSPVYKGHTVNGNELWVEFDHVESGIRAVKEVTEFELCGDDYIYYPAVATIVGERVKLTSNAVQNPVAVRYAWKNAGTLSIFTTGELPLPLSPFRSYAGGGGEEPSADREIPFENIKNVYASSVYPGRLPLYAVNGAGLINNTTHEASMMSKAWHTNETGFPYSFKIELDAPRSISALRIWNLNWTEAYLTRGAKEIEIYVADSRDNLEYEPFESDVWKKTATHTLSMATGVSSYAGELFSVEKIPSGVNWVGIKLLGNYNSATFYTGLSEIKMYEKDGLTHLQLCPEGENRMAVFFCDGKKLSVSNLSGSPLHGALSSVQGALLWQSPALVEESGSWDLPDFQSGMYILTLVAGTKRESYKLLLNN